MAQVNTNALRFILMGLNVLGAISGIIFIGMGLYTWTETAFASKAIVITMIATGAFVFVLSFVGGSGAFFESRKTLLLYFVPLAALVTTQIVLAIIAYSNRHNVDNYLDKAWQKAYDSHPRAIRDIEEEYSCCGFRDVMDRAYPKSKKDSCVTSPFYGYHQACYDALSAAVVDNQGSLASTGIILAVIQLLGLITAFLLITYLPNEEERDEELLAEHRRLVNNGRNNYGSS
ncbi:Tetraspannin-domain-containing protein [Basidiobolus meristosporus CBS 931.73]|uniref:Tetraspannin-domain-containing protein n=1 Tax=Basidiobolus meristosporus CBS 931.73 TaxID=1314790 RepID=A0A1Y1YQ27_9FUNG|nr:Tetraspannin-domain-containing protein [Basidiobolus meristosporus CBS 931.73]|eukprot:ORY00118.1 Tetraspannin-domain-containing protein [Basidiobolus meristosporus CBS 931.73]